MTSDQYEDRIFDELPAYALGALDDEARLAVEDHVESCPRCQLELEELLEASAALAFNVPPVEVPRRVKQRLMARLDEEETAVVPAPRRRFTLVMPRFARSAPLAPADAGSRGGIVQVMRPRATYRHALVAASVMGLFAVSLAVFFATHDLGNKMQGLQSAVSSEATAVSDLSQPRSLGSGSPSAPPTASVSTQGSTDVSQLAIANQQLQEMLHQQILMSQRQAEPQASTLLAKGMGSGEQALGTFVTARQERPLATLIVYGLAPAPAGKVYQLWLDYDGQPHSAITFNVDSMQYVWLEIPLPPGSPEYLTGSITVEPAGGSTHPTGPTVMMITPP